MHTLIQHAFHRSRLQEYERNVHVHVHLRLLRLYEFVCTTLIFYSYVFIYRNDSTVLFVMCMSARKRRQVVIKP